MGDNFGVTVISKGREHLEAAVRLAFANCPGGKATHYRNGIPERQCTDCYGRGEESRLPPNFKRGDPMVVIQCRNCTTGRLSAESAMILYWHEPEKWTEWPDACSLPFPLSAEATIPFLWNYLQTADYPPEPDHDGDNGKGFLLTTGNGWGHVEGSHYSIFMVKPEWQMYGK